MSLTSSGDVRYEGKGLTNAVGTWMLGSDPAVNPYRDGATRVIVELPDCIG